MKSNKSTAVTAKQPMPKAAPDQATALMSPRQIALAKLYRFLWIVGIVGGVGALLTFPLYQEWLWKAIAGGSPNKMQFREPKLNANEPPGPAPEGMVWVPG